MGKYGKHFKESGEVIELTPEEILKSKCKSINRIVTNNIVSFKKALELYNVTEEEYNKYIK